MSLFQNLVILLAHGVVLASMIAVLTVSLKVGRCAAFMARPMPRSELTSMSDKL